MKDNSYLRQYGDDDVLSFASGQMFKVGKFREAVKFAFTDPHRIPYSLSDALREKGVSVGGANTQLMLEQGVDGEVLRIGAKGWQKGKIRIRITVEFYPDEPQIAQPESPLDDLRQMINQQTQQ